VTDTAKPELDPRFVAGVDLLRRSGMRTFRVGYSDEADGDPVVWYAVGTWGLDPRTRRPLPVGGRISHEAAASIHPVQAVLRLCEQVIDGGTCAHCGKRTVFSPDVDSTFEQMLTAGLEGCLYAWDPELATFRRGCEGDDPPTPTDRS
jgi:hypothetical protein